MKTLTKLAVAVMSVFSFANIKSVAAQTDTGSVSGVVTTLNVTPSATITATGEVLGATQNAGLLSYWWVILLIVVVLGVVLFFATKKS